MKLTVQQLFIRLPHNESTSCLEEWAWLIKQQMKINLVTAIGDAILTDLTGKVYLLDVGNALIEPIAPSKEGFMQLTSDTTFVNEVLKPRLVEELMSSHTLQNNQVFSFTKLPTLGGEFTADNFKPKDISVHFSVSGNMQQQIKKLPDDTPLTKSLVD